MENGIKLFIPIKPMGAVRTTQKQKWMDERAKRYFTYKLEIAHIAKQTFKQPSEKPILADVTFYLPIPANGRSKKKKVYPGDFHQVKPDLDNLIKGVFDSLNGISWKDDNQVCEFYCRKLYSNNPGIALEMWELGEDGEKAEQMRQKET